MRKSFCCVFQKADDLICIYSVLALFSDGEPKKCAGPQSTSRRPIRFQRKGEQRRPALSRQRTVRRHVNVTSKVEIASKAFSEQERCWAYPEASGDASEASPGASEAGLWMLPEGQKRDYPSLNLYHVRSIDRYGNDVFLGALASQLCDNADCNAFGARA